MPLFISYSHQNKEFVDRLATQLISHKLNVWLDRWELNVGDSIVAKVQDAITGASGLLVVLSKASVESEWCKKELNAGLIRELEERRVVVLPVMLEDCAVPIFLRDKVFADFRNSFDEGLKTILEATARVTNEAQSRIETPEFHIDWAIDWVHKNGDVEIHLTLCEHDIHNPYTILINIFLRPEGDALETYLRLCRNDKGEVARYDVLQPLVDLAAAGEDFPIIFEDQFEQHFVLDIAAGERGTVRCAILARRMGMDTGRDTLVHLGPQLIEIHKHMHDVLVRPAQDPPRAGR